MTPLATARRLRRHGKVVAGFTAGAALAGVAAASMAFTVTQDGSAAVAPSAATTDVASEEPSLLPLPEIPDIGDIGVGVVELMELVGPASSPPAAVNPSPGVEADTIGHLMPSQGPPLLGGAPDAPSEPTATLEHGPVPILDVVPAPVGRLAPPDAAAPIARLADEVAEPLSPVTEPLTDATTNITADALDDGHCLAVDVVQIAPEPDPGAAESSQDCETPDLDDEELAAAPVGPAIGSVVDDAAPLVSRLGSAPHDASRVLGP